MGRYTQTFELSTNLAMFYTMLYAGAKYRV